MPKRTTDKRKPETIIRELRYKLTNAAALAAEYKRLLNEQSQLASDAMARERAAIERAESLRDMLEISQDLLKVSEAIRMGRT